MTTSGRNTGGGAPGSDLFRAPRPGKTGTWPCCRASVRRRSSPPATRLALATFAWNHRHEILRWGRTLYDQVIGRTDVSPARAVRTGHLLFAIASDKALRNAPELHKVTMIDDTVDLDVDERGPSCPG